ncbi:hypothetical protein ACMHYJ_14240 [Castellaniella hirudinis]|uniref:hypothetical protein n=1 Tax=Castellaniella hirudinis TaxID=1144617 RepID=UPI0039C0A141
MTKTEAITNAVARYIKNGGNEQAGLKLVAELIAEPWCLAESLRYWNLATNSKAAGMAEALLS